MDGSVACDPVMGDEGKLYVPQDLVSLYREKVLVILFVLHSDFITVQFVCKENKLLLNNL